MHFGYILRIDGTTSQSFSVIITQRNRNIEYMLKLLNMAVNLSNISLHCGFGTQFDVSNLSSTRFLSAFWLRWVILWAI